MCNKISFNKICVSDQIMGMCLFSTKLARYQQHYSSLSQFPDDRWVSRQIKAIGLFRSNPISEWDSLLVNQFDINHNLTTYLSSMKTSLYECFPTLPFVRNPTTQFVKPQVQNCQQQQGSTVPDTEAQPSDTSLKRWLEDSSNHSYPIQISRFKIETSSDDLWELLSRLFE